MESTNSNPMSFSDANHSSSVIQKLLEQRESGEFCDAFLCAKGMTFPVHSNILAMRSTYFEYSFRLKNNLTVICEDLGIFKLFLDFLYTGVTTVNSDNVFELVKLASTFKVESLKKICEEFLNQNITVHNCFRLKEISITCDIPSLKKNVSSFMADNVTDILESDETLRLTIDGIKTFLEDSFNLLPEIFLMKLICRWTETESEARSQEFYSLLNYVPWVCFDHQELVSHILSCNLFHKNIYCKQVFVKFLKEKGVYLEEFREPLASSNFLNYAVACDGSDSLAATNDVREFGSLLNDVPSNMTSISSDTVRNCENDVRQRFSVSSSRRYISSFANDIKKKYLKMSRKEKLKLEPKKIFYSCKKFLLVEKCFKDLNKKRKRISCRRPLKNSRQRHINNGTGTFHDNAFQSHSRMTAEELESSHKLGNNLNNHKSYFPQKNFSAAKSCLLPAHKSKNEAEKELQIKEMTVPNPPCSDSKLVGYCSDESVFNACSNANTEINYICNYSDLNIKNTSLVEIENANHAYENQVSETSVNNSVQNQFYEVIALVPSENEIDGTPVNNSFENQLVKNNFNNCIENKICKTNINIFKDQFGETDFKYCSESLNADNIRTSCTYEENYSNNEIDKNEMYGINRECMIDKEELNSKEMFEDRVSWTSDIKIDEVVTESTKSRNNSHETHPYVPPYIKTKLHSMDEEKFKSDRQEKEIDAENSNFAECKSRKCKEEMHIEKLNYTEDETIQSMSNKQVKKKMKRSTTSPKSKRIKSNRLRDRNFRLNYLFLNRTGNKIYIIPKEKRKFVRLDETNNNLAEYNMQVTTTTLKINKSPQQ
ncbi:Kelch-like protein 21 like protein [Argiope bruennichi]|uniref:Kelch-like protein 21 like protein n=1 Tax=Argiope bruennichi TaxID=94029 RepID=A0A8T0ECI8_ARGBR|nr:Kelch-like protein 21 like protein [Argiope bruennichi]